MSRRTRVWSGRRLPFCWRPWLGGILLSVLNIVGPLHAVAQQAPTIVTQPSSLTNIAGTAATFTVSATGDEPLSYQWFRDATNAIAQGTNASLQLASVQLADAGSYSVVVSNVVGTALSANARLVVLGLDFGDAPDPPYPTLLTSDGARHVVVPAVRLGSTITAEPDGQPDSSAAGDTNPSGTEEDGVVFLTPLRAGQAAVVRVTASTNGVLSAWVDFNRAGGWAQAGEQIFTNRAVNAGTNLLGFNVPNATLPGQSFARFRFATAGPLTTTGLALDGEVEDHAVSLLPSANLAVGISVASSRVSPGNNGTYTISVTNVGPSSATGVVLTNVLSIRSSYFSVSSSQGSCAPSNGVVSCTLGTLASGARATVTLTAKIGAGTNILSATALSDALDPVLANNSNSATIVGSTTLSFSNPDTIVLPLLDPGPGSIYPANIVVSGLTSAVLKATVTLRNINHSFPDDIDVLLVGPRGHKIYLMSDCGVDIELVDVNVTLDDEATQVVPDTLPGIVSGTYRPSNYGTLSDNFPAPAPAPPYVTNLSVLINSDPNGVWSLFVQDDQAENGMGGTEGFFADGWSLTLTTGDPLADLSITQTAQPNPVIVGNVLTYSMVVSNRGPSSSTATVRDILPPGMTYLSAVPSQGTCVPAGGVVDCTLGTLANGGSASITLRVTPTLGGPATNVASVFGSQLDVNPTNSQATTVTTVTPVADLQLTVVSNPTPILLGQPATFLLTITNHGPNTASGVFVTNLLPPELAYVQAFSSQGSCNHQSGRVLCPLGNLATGVQATVQIITQPTATGIVSNFISVAAAPLDFVPTNNVVSQVLQIFPSADLTLNVVAPGPVLALNQPVTLLLSVTNQGPNSTPVTLIDTLPATLVIVDSATSRGNCVGTLGSLNCDLGIMDPGSSALVNVTLRPSVLGRMTNAVVLNSNLGDPTPADRRATNIFNVLAAADIEMTLQESRDPVWLGDNLVYRLCVTNRGPSPATTVLVTNHLPPGINVLSFLPGQGNCTRQGSDLMCSLGTLTAGAGTVVTVTTRPDAVTSLSASAQALSELIDPNPANNTTAQTTQVVDISGGSSNLASINIPRVGAATPYPSTVFVSGLTASVYTVRVTLTNLTHTYADDLDILLVGPDGRGVMLMSDAGGDSTLQNTRLEFDDQAPEELPDSGILVSGTFRPTNYEPLDQLPAPAPPGPYGTNLNTFRGIDPNGPWSLYIVDDAEKDSGQLLGGWSLTLATLQPIANLALKDFASANPVGVSSNLVLTYAVTNFGPAVATGTRLTNVPPSGIQLLGAITSSGNCSIVAGTVICDLNSLAAGAGAVVQVSARVQRAGLGTNFVSVQSIPEDLIPTNNQSATILVFEDPPVFTVQPVSVVATNGDTVLLEAAAVGTEPLSYQWQRNGADVPGATEPRLVFSSVTPIKSGLYRLRVSNRVGVAFSASATLTVIGPPTISDIPPVTIDEDTLPPPLPFTVIDFESPPEAILLFFLSSDESLVPRANITATGGGTNHDLLIIPARDAAGEVTISIIALDPDARASTNSFLLTIRQINDPPTIQAIADQQTTEDTPAQVPFVVSDLEQSGDELLYAISSSNPALVLPSGVSFSGSGNQRLAQITPVHDQFGSARITIHVTDAGGLSVSNQFILTVTSENDFPTVDVIPDLAIDEDSGSHVVALTGITAGAPNETQHLTVTAHSANLALIPDPLVTYTSPASSGLLTFTPLPNASGAVELTVTVRDGQTTNNSFSRTFVVNITPTNDAPLLSELSEQIIDEDVVLALPFSVSDPDSALDTLTVAATSSNPDLITEAGLKVTGEGDLRVLTLTPLANQSGQATITLRATDPNGASTTITFLLTVNSVNDVPTLDALADRNLLEDAPAQVVNLTGISSGAPNETQTVNVRAVSSNPSVVPEPIVRYTNDNSNGTLTFQPATNATGTAVITVTVDDGDLTNNIMTRSFTVTVAATNDSPVISGLGATVMDEDTLGIVPFQVTDAESPSLLLVLNATSSNQSFVANTNLLFEGDGTNRTLLIRPQTNQFGTLTINVTASDGAHVTTNSFALTINPVNDQPTLNPLTNINQTTSPGSTTVPLSGITSGATNEVQALSVTANNSNPALFLNAPSVSYPGSGTTGTLTFRTANNTVGTAVISVTVDDNGAVNDTITRSFILNVRALANAQPTISLIGNQTIPEDTSTVPLPFTVRDDETVASALTLTVASSNPTLLPTNNIVVLGGPTNRTITLTPLSNQTGVATITLTATDTAFGSTNLSFNLTVTPVNDPPTVTAIPDVTTLSGVPTGPIAFTVADADNSPSSLLVTASSDNAALLPNANIALGGSGSARGLVLTPVNGQEGSARVTVRVTDTLATNSTSFVLHVNPTNHPPVLSTIPDIETAEDTTPVPVSFTVSDSETAPELLTLTAEAANPGLIQQATLGGTGNDRTLTVVPAANQFGSTTIQVTLTDGGGISVVKSLRCTVAPVNDAPTLDLLPDLLLNPGAPLQNVPLTGIGTGAANETQTLAVSASTSQPGLLANLLVQYTSPASAGVLTFQPVPGAEGIATVTVKVSDGQSTNGTTSRTFSVTLNGSPQFSYIPDQQTLEDVATSPIPFSVMDSETPPELLTLSASSSNPELLPPPLLIQGTGTNRFMILNPATNLFGTATISIVATDTNGASATNQFVLEVEPVIDPIEILVQPSSLSALVGASATLQVSATSLLPLTYQWRQNGADVPNATQATLSFPSLQLSDAGTYQVIVRNADTSVASAEAVLGVFAQAPSPRILSIVLQGSAVTLQATSVKGVSYALESSDSLSASSWRVVTTLVGTGVPLTFTDLNPTSPHGFYRIRRN